jgi:predicted metal-dependent peptidase
MHDVLSKISKTILFKEPFYGLFLIGLKKNFTDDLPTAAVGRNGINTSLYVNPDFFKSLDDDKKYGLIKHELLHIAFGHMTMRDIFQDKKLFNIAADLEINQYIDEYQLPEGGITMDSFPELSLPYRAGTKEYYKLLKQAQDQGKSESLQNLLDSQDGNSPYDHNTWEEFDELPESTQRLIEKQIDHQINTVAETLEKSSGNIPGEIKSILKRIRHVEPPKFDWRGYLRRFVGNSNIVYTKKTRKKINKRFPGNPAIKVKTRSHILVGIDTSASVNNNELKEFMAELYHISKTGNQITIAQCDTVLNSVEKFNPKKDLNIKGRGGTDFQPVIDHYNEKGYYTTLIYFTDGEASSPNNCPKNTLWVHSSISQINESLPGRCIKIN